MSTEPGDIEREYLGPHFDDLTGLPNRGLFMNTLRDEIDRGPGRCALLAADLDDTKETNDEGGHEKGDVLIIEAARALDDVARTEIDPERPRELDTLAILPSAFRVGGDEYMILLADVSTQEQIDAFKDRAQKHLAEKGIRVSIGGKVHEPGETAEDLIRAADVLMYADKKVRKDAKYKEDLDTLSLGMRLLHKLGRTCLEKSGLGIPPR